MNNAIHAHGKMGHKDLSAVFLIGTDKEELVRILLEEGVRLKAVILPFRSTREERLRSVVAFSQRVGIPVLRPKRVALEETLRELMPDLLISAGYPYLLSANQLSVARFNINIHPTLLPKYRGTATTWHVLANGEKEGGVSIHFIDEGMDTGPILVQRAFPLTPFDTLKSYMRKANALEPVLLRQALQCFVRGETEGTLQREEEATIFPEIRTGADSRIDSEKPVLELYNFIRACDPDRFPAFFEIDGQKVGIKLFRLNKPDDEQDML